MGIIFDCASKVPFAEGGEGILYEHNGQLVKIYKPVVDLRAKQHKVRMLIQKTLHRQLPAEVIAPEDTVTDKSGAFIGFSMNKAVGEEFKRLANKKFVTANNITTKDILSMLVKLQKVIARLHDSHIFIGDLNDQNILFDRQFNIYLIDCDSWTVEDEKCKVAMDLFKDPLLQADDFNARTDTYAFAVMAWKLLTRIHPFGGTMNPDKNIMERMRQGICVIDNPQVTIPKTIKSWQNLSPFLIKALQNIFENKSRELSDELEDMQQHLKFCNIHQDYYYGKYAACPLCDKDAELQMRPQGMTGGLRLSALLPAGKVKTMFNEHLYLDNNDYIVDIRQNQKVKYQYGARYYFTADGYCIEDFADAFVVHSQREYRIEKRYKSRIVVEGNHIYFISKKNSLTDMTVLGSGNSTRVICKCSNTAYFDVKAGNYCVLNCYCGKLIITANGANTEIKYDTDVINYGIHYDAVTSKWLILLEDSTGKHRTYMIDNRIIAYETDQIKYQGQLSAPCISNSTLYIPMDGKIRGFSYIKSVYKDFVCDVVNGNSMLIKRKKQFMIVNDENVYLLG